MRIYLIGYMGSGKTTVGKKLARLVEYDFVDMDELFEEKYHISVEAFFEKYDENAFRKIETQLLKTTEQMDQVVISTGGGAPCFSDNLLLMKNLGLTVYLQMSVAALANRLNNAKKTRPLLKSLDEKELNKFIRSQLSEREAFYRQAHIIVSGENCDLETLIRSIKLHPLFK